MTWCTLWPDPTCTTLSLPYKLKDVDLSNGARLTLGAIFDYRKAHYIIFSRRKQVKPQLVFGDRQLEPVTEVKRLGITLDKKLTYSKHLTAVNKPAE